MTTSSLDRCINDIRRDWTGLNSQTIAAVHRHLRRLVTVAAPDEPWLTALHGDLPPAVELHRDPDHGFVLLGHTERAGHRWPPHDHGAGWVFYAVQHGETTMATYKPITDPTGATHLVSRGSFTVGPGESHVFLPGDVHSTRCVSDYLVQLRLTSTDIAVERAEGRMITHPDPEAQRPTAA